MYLAEFTFPGTLELVNDLFIEGSEAEALEFAQDHATSWGVELFSLVEVTHYPGKLPKWSAENIILKFPPLFETVSTAS
jgi:hypothetical protein